MKKLFLLFITVIYMFTGCFSVCLAEGYTRYEFPEITLEEQLNTTEHTESSAALKGSVKKISKGTSVEAYLQSGISTATAQEGEVVAAVLKDNWYYKNALVAPQGSVIYGQISKARPSAFGSRNGYVQIAFTKLITIDGKEYDISTEKIDFKVTNEGKVTSSVVTVAKWAVAGAVLGALVGVALGDSGSSIAKSALIGAGAFGGTSAIGAAAERGIDAEIPAYTDLEIVLDEPLKVLVNY